MASTDSTSGEHATIWFDTCDVPKYQPLGKSNITTDVCVVGSGFAGLQTAYALTLEGKKVVVIEARDLISGESGRTTAQLMSGLDDRWYKLRKYHGAKGAQLAAESHIEAINIIERNVKRENIDCDFTRCNAYLVAKDQTKSSLAELDQELEAAKAAGHTGAHIIAKSLMGENVCKAVVFPDQGDIHPLKYLVGLAKAIESKGGKIYTQTKGSEFKGEGGQKATVKTVDGGEIQCQAIVLAMNNSVNSMEVLLKQEPFRSYVITAPVPKNSVRRALLWDTADPYRYVRIYPKDETSDWLIVGGEDHKVGQAGQDYAKPYQELEKWSRERFPLMGAIDYKWSGEVFEPADGLAYLGRHAHDKDNVYLITGDSGTGLTHTTIGAKIVTDLIMGRPNDWADLYSPLRKPTGSLGAIRNFVVGATEMASGYLEWLKPGDIKDIEDLAPNSGGVLIKNGTHIACYKDENGKVSQCSALCTHLGGLVNWNADEKSWDCPCHGSRFDKYGKCLQGPAVKDLAPVS